MRTRSRTAVTLLATGTLALVPWLRDPAVALASPSARASALTVTGATVGPAIPSGFLGLSVEFRGLAAYAGDDPTAVDPVFLQLLRDISPDQQPVLRIGGDSTDWTWWPVPGMRRPAGVKYALTPDWMAVTRAVATALQARLILGINLEANSSSLAAAEARAIVDRIGRASISALEIGNEPELYGTFGWYKSAAGLQVPGRPPAYSFPDFTHDFARIARSMPNVALAAPSSGSPTWLPRLGSFLRSEPRVRLATVHAYPLKHCPPAPGVVTVGQLLSDSSSHGLAATVAPYVAAAHSHGVPLRVDEMNAVTCGGARGVSDTFVSALWALDALFEMAKVGVHGVNIQTVPNTINEVLGASFAQGGWIMRVHPEYYGLIMFAQAAPPGSRLLVLSGQPATGVKLWATRAPDGQVHVVAINKHVRRSEVLHLHLPSTAAPATVEQLRAPNVEATANVTLGGQSFGPGTSTGVLAGPTNVTTLAPVGGAYVVRVPAASATMLTLAPQ